jgi:hypothetical protein
MVSMIVLVFCCIVAVSGCTSNNNSTNQQATNNSSSNTSNVTNSNTTSSNTSNSSDIYVVVNYPGNWAADVSGQFGYRALSGTGDQTTNLGSITGAVTISGRKTEGGSETITVSIKKGGKTLSSQSINTPYGGASATAVV